MSERLRHHKHNKEYPGWSASGAERKDFRRAKMEPEAPRHRKRNRPSGKKWCRRKVGQEHAYVLKGVSQHMVIEVCENCGRKGQWWSDYSLWRQKEIPEKVQLMLDNPE